MAVVPGKPCGCLYPESPPHVLPVWEKYDGSFGTIPKEKNPTRWICRGDRDQHCWGLVCTATTKDDNPPECIYDLDTPKWEKDEPTGCFPPKMATNMLDYHEASIQEMAGNLSSIQELVEKLADRSVEMKERVEKLEHQMRNHYHHTGYGARLMTAAGPRGW